MGRKVFKTGDIVYWCKKEGYEYSVGFGRVDEHLGGVVYINYLVLDDRRTVSSAYFKDVPVKVGLMIQNCISLATMPLVKKKEKKLRHLK